MNNTAVEKVISVADFAVSKDENCTLVTYSLGSCIGLSIWDPVAKIGGLLHYMLPASSNCPGKASDKPCMFADTGVPLLFKSCYSLGAKKQRLVVKVAGGSQLLHDQGMFDIGRRNYLFLRKLLWKNNVMIDAEDVGGCVARTMRLEIGTGRVSVKTGSQEYEL